MDKLLEMITAKLAGSELLTEEFKVQIKAELEKAINEKVETQVKEKTDVITQAYDEKLVEQNKEGQAKLDEYTTLHTAKISEYISEGVKEFIDKNEIAIEAGITVEKAKNLTDGMRELLEANDLTIDTEKVDVVKELEANNTALKEQNDKVINEKREALTQCFEYEKVIKFNELVTDLTEVQKESVLSTLTGMTFDLIEDFTRQTNIIIETVKGKEKTDTNNINEDKKIDDISDSLSRTEKQSGNGLVNHLL